MDLCPETNFKGSSQLRQFLKWIMGVGENLSESLRWGWGAGLGFTSFSIAPRLPDSQFRYYTA